MRAGGWHVDSFSVCSQSCVGSRILQHRVCVFGMIAESMSTSSESYFSIDCQKKVFSPLAHFSLNVKIKSLKSSK